MNRRQLAVITAKLRLSASRAQAVREVVIRQCSDADAERAAHGRVTHTVRRDVKRVNKMFRIYEDIENVK